MFLETTEKRDGGRKARVKATCLLTRDLSDSPGTSRACARDAMYHLGRYDRWAKGGMQHRVERVVCGGLAMFGGEIVPHGW